MVIEDTAVIKRRSLHGELAAQLRDMLMRGELKPGDKISEQMLCSRFGVYRTPLREALKVLANEGVLILSPNRERQRRPHLPRRGRRAVPDHGRAGDAGRRSGLRPCTPEDVARVEAMHAADGRWLSPGKFGRLPPAEPPDPQKVLHWRWPATAR